MLNTTSSIPLINRWWFQIASLILIAPIGAALMLCCAAYRRKDDRPVRIRKSAKALLMILVLPIYFLILARVIGYENLGHAAGRVYRALSSVL